MNKPKPDPSELARPTYWPMFVGLAITGIAWGLITSWIVSVVASVVLIISMIGWIQEVSE
jgi:hypothetical protein